MKSKAQEIRTNRHDSVFAVTRHHQLCGIPASAPAFAQIQAKAVRRSGARTTPPRRWTTDLLRATAGTPASKKLSFCWAFCILKRI